MRMHQPLHPRSKVVTDDNVSSSFLPPLDSGSTRSSFSTLNTVCSLRRTFGHQFCKVFLTISSMSCDDGCTEWQGGGWVESAAKASSRDRGAAAHTGAVGGRQAPVTGFERGPRRDPQLAAALHRAEPPEPARRPCLHGLLGGAGPTRVPADAGRPGAGRRARIQQCGPHLRRGHSCQPWRSLCAGIWRSLPYVQYRCQAGGGVALH